MMTKRDVVRLVLEGKRPPYVPWSMGFTKEAREKLQEHFGCLDIEEPLGNHLLKLGSDIGFFEDLGNDRVRDVFGVVWDRSIDKDIGNVEGQVLPEPTLAGYEFPDPLDPRFFADIPAKIERAPDRFGVFQIGFSLYERAWTLRGMEALMTDFLDHPQFEQVTFNAIRNVLTNELIEQSCREVDYVFRRRVITPVVTVLHMVMAAIFYVRYQSMGLEFLTRAHQRLKVSRVKRHLVDSANDFVGRLNINKLYRRRDPMLPAHITVRFVQARLSIRGQCKNVWFVTSLLDARQYPASEIVALYAQRWRIETLFREVKITLSADVLRSRNPEGIRKEITARLVALNVVRTIMVEAAARAEVDPDRISFVHAVRAVISFSPALARSPVFQLRRIYEAMLAEIANHLVPSRPGRLEPRAVRRERKHYPALSDTCFPPRG